MLGGRKAGRPRPSEPRVSFIEFRSKTWKLESKGDLIPVEDDRNDQHVFVDAGQYQRSDQGGQYPFEEFLGGLADQAPFEEGWGNAGGLDLFDPDPLFGGGPY